MTIQATTDASKSDQPFNKMQHNQKISLTAAMHSELRLLLSRSIYLLLILLLMAASFIQHANAADAELADNINSGDISWPSNSAASGTLWLRHQGGIVQAPILNSKAEIAVSGILAKVTLFQEFANESNQLIDGQYVFPLPESAAVRAARITINDRIIEGEIREKKQAEQIFERAKTAGNTSGLVRQQRDNLFSINLSNIVGKGRIRVEIDYLETITVDRGEYSLALPLTYIPRYSNELVPKAEAALLTGPQLSRTQARAGNSHTFDLSLLLVSDLQIEQLSSPSHAITYTPVTEGYQISLNTQAHLDRDFELRWKWQIPFRPTTSVYTETIDETLYMLGLINSASPINTATTNDAEPRLIPRELVVVIDTSGSMDGAPLRTARQALQSALNGLNASDYLNIVRFSDWTESLYPASRAVSAETLREARRFIDSLDANGGTEMFEAVEFALDGKNVPPEVLRQIVFITDGAVGYERDVMSRIEKKLGNARLFTVGIGHSPNRDFMKKIATAGRGTYTFIRDISAVDSKIQTLFQKIERPVMRDIQITWLGEPADMAQSRLRDLHDGEPLVIAAKLHPGTRGFEVRGTLAGELWQETVYFEHDANAAISARQIEPFDQSGISSIWARQRIGALMEKYHALPAEPKQEHVEYIDVNNKPVYAQLSPKIRSSQQGNDENGATRSAIRQQVTDLGITHHLLSPFTAFVAIDSKTVANRSANTPATNIPSLVPAGNLQMVPMPQTATAIDLYTLISIASFLIALIAGMCLLYLEKNSFHTSSRLGCSS